MHRNRPSNREVINGVKNHGGISAYARYINFPRETVRDWHKAAKVWEENLTQSEGKFKRQTYIITNAQIDTKVDPVFMNNLETLAKVHNAEILIPCTTYNKRGMGHNGTGDADKKFDEDFYDPRVQPYIMNERLKLNDKCEVLGNLNILPTAVNPLSGYESFTGTSTAILPHCKIAFSSVATNPGKMTKFLMTSGSCTVPNFMQKNAGIKGEFHHQIGATIIEVVNDKKFYHRQVLADQDGSFYDLTDYYTNGMLTTGHRIEGITWGDIHEADLDEDVLDASWARPDALIDTLKPKYQFFHDLLDFKYRNHHNRGSDLFMKVMNNASVEDELIACGDFLGMSYRNWCESVIVASNHDDAFDRWVNETAIMDEPNLDNGILLAECKLAKMKEAKKGRNVAMFPWFINNEYKDTGWRFLKLDESFKVLGIECGQHGDHGINGSRGSAKALTKVGTKMNLGHSHCLTQGHMVNVKGRGFVPIEEVSVGEHVVSFDPVTKKNVYSKVLDTIASKHTGSMITIGSQGTLRQEVTDKHNMFLEDGSYLPITEAIVTRSVREVPICANSVISPNNTDLTELDVRKIVAICADAHIDKDGYISFNLKKDRKIARVQELFSEDLANINSKNIRDTCKMSITTGSPTWEMLSNNILGRGKDKCLPEKLRELGTDLKQVLIEELRFWDGTYTKKFEGGQQWSSTKECEANIVSSILNELGYRVTWKHMYKTKGNGQHIISFNANKSERNISDRQDTKNRISQWRPIVEEVEDVPVYCLTTEHSNFWIRHVQSGLVSLTGNSACIIEGVYQSGCSRTLNASYAKGASSWSHTHILIYPNGKRTLITLIDGEYYHKAPEEAGLFI